MDPYQWPLAANILLQKAPLCTDWLTNNLWIIIHGMFSKWVAAAVVEIEGLVMLAFQLLFYNCVVPFKISAGQKLISKISNFEKLWITVSQWKGEENTFSQWGFFNHLKATLTIYQLIIYFNFKWVFNISFSFFSCKF